MYMTYLTWKGSFLRTSLGCWFLRCVYSKHLSYQSSFLSSCHRSNLSNPDAPEAPTFLLQAAAWMLTSSSPSITFLLKSPNASCYKIKLRLWKPPDSSVFSQTPRKSCKRTWRVAKCSRPTISNSSTQHRDGRCSDMLKLWVWEGTWLWVLMSAIKSLHWHPQVQRHLCMLLAY